MSADVLVAGGGPAGSAMATRLAEAGHRVVLVDRAHFPRAKPCGECLSPAAVAALGRLGALHAVLALPHASIAGWTIRPLAGVPFDGLFPANEPGIAVSRALLDQALLDLARSRGVEVRTGVKVVDLLRSGGAVVGVRTTEGEIRARLVVGADGLRSVVARRLGSIRRAPRLRKLALTAHVTGVADLPRGELRLRRWGCVGVAAVGGGITNVTVVVNGADARAVAGGAERYFDEAIAREPALRGARRAGPVLATGPFDAPTRGAVADGALLLGDAAGYYDPFTGQGIYRALRGAELAAPVAIGALRDGEATARALAPYEAARRAAFGPGERLQKVIEGFVSRPALMRPVAALLARRPRLADALVAVTGDLRPLRSLVPSP